MNRDESKLIRWATELSNQEGYQGPHEVIKLLEDKRGNRNGSKK